MIFETGIDPIVCEENCSFYMALYSWCVRQMTYHRNKGNNEQAVRWGVEAATIASGDGSFGLLTDLVCEDVLLSIGRSLKDSPFTENQSDKKRYLHVLSEAYSGGGHTNLCMRWITSDSTNSCHHMIITSQKAQLSDRLRREVELQNGKFTVLDSTLPWTERAIQLRKIACQDADIIVLHTHPMDPLPVLSFAIDDTPPIVLLNHADHLYWLGASVADLVINLRDSGQSITQKCRGIENAIILPIPLGKAVFSSEDKSIYFKRRNQEKEKLGIPEEAIVFLTIGTEYKYDALGDYDFINTAEKILERSPTAYLIAIGPAFGSRWEAASERCGGRLLALGVKEDLSTFHEMADIYLEGFPFGSLTALLEAGLAGLPCVGAPAITPLPYRSDDIALDCMIKPSSIAEYISEATRLAFDGDARVLIGRNLKAAIYNHHCGSGWSKHLEQLYNRLPDRHIPGLKKKPYPMPLYQRNYWGAFKWGGKKIDYVKIYKSIYQNAEWTGFPLIGSIDSKFDRDLYSLAKHLKNRAGLKYNWLCEICVDNGFRAFVIKDIKSIAISLFRCLYIAPSSIRNRALISLLVRSLFGDCFWKVAHKRISAFII